VFARTICGEGFPDFWAKRVIGKHPVCINRLVDIKLDKYFNAVNVCFDMDKFGFQVDDNGDYLISDCQTKNFAMYYTSKQSMAAFRALYKNEHGIQDAFVNYWDVTTEHLFSNPYVVGFDPLNEPFMGNMLKEPRLLTPKYMDQTELAPLYTRLYNEAYTKHDPEAIMWFEPNQFPD